MMRLSTTAATMLAILLGVAGCSSAGYPPGAPFFASMDEAGIIPGLPISVSTTTMTDIWGNTVAAPGTDLSHGGSTTQSLGVAPPGAGNTGGGRG